jgi:hypothetical protein
MATRGMTMTPDDFRSALHDVTSPKRAVIQRRSVPDGMGQARWCIVMTVPGRPVVVMYWRGTEGAICTALRSDGYAITDTTREDFPSAHEIAQAAGAEVRVVDVAPLPPFEEV